MEAFVVFDTVLIFFGVSRAILVLGVRFSEASDAAYQKEQAQNCKYDRENTRSFFIYEIVVLYIFAVTEKLQKSELFLG